MVGFDGTGFDNIRINGSLGQETDTLQFAGLLLKHADELRTDDLALLLGIGHACELVQETVDGIHIDKVGVQLVAEYADYLLGLAFAQKAVIDVD